jgi:outer membrane biosynthesis protein TonB
MDTLLIKKEEQKNKIIGYVTTIGIHALILFLLLWMMLSPPNPPLEYGGMELSMSLGEMNMGGPNPEPQPIPEQVQPVPVSQPEEVIATQDVEEAPSIKTSKEKPTKTTPVPIKQEPVEQPRKVDERAIFKKKSQDGAAGSGSGTIPGNQGNPDGVPGGSPNGNGIGDGKGGTGGGTGTGDGWGSFNLAGRSLTRKPNIEDQSRETGRVVVQIVVDRNGRVIKAAPGFKGTNITSNTLWEKAKQGALETRFSANPNGPEEQFGTMTFEFKFKP